MVRDPQHGSVACEDAANDTVVCDITCDEGYEQQENQPSEIECGPETDHLWPDQDPDSTTYTPTGCSRRFNIIVIK